MILVTGGAGYIGSVLVPELLVRGEKVRVFDKLYFGKDSLQDVLNRIDLVQGDIREFDERILDGVTGVIHLAALSNDPCSEYNPEANMQINFQATENLAKACKQKGIKRFVYASSCSVYYTLDPHDDLKDEETPVNPTAPYSLSKHMAEKVLKALADDNFCPVMLRKGTVFGQSPRMRYDLVVNTFVKDAQQKGRLTVTAGGEMWRPLLDIKDAADAYIQCLKAPEDKVKGQVFNVVHKNYRVLELAHWVKEVLNAKKQIEVDVKYFPPTASRSYRVSFDKIKGAIGFEARRGIAQAANEMWEVIDGKVTYDLNDPIYYNIKWMCLLEEMQEKLKIIGRIF